MNNMNKYQLDCRLWININWIVNANMCHCIWIAKEIVFFHANWLKVSAGSIFPGSQYFRRHIYYNILLYSSLCICIFSASNMCHRFTLSHSTHLFINDLLLHYMSSFAPSLYRLILNWAVGPNPNIPLFVPLCH